MPVLKYHVNGFIEQLLFCIVSFTQHVALGIPPHFFKVSGKCFPLHCFVFHCVNVPPLLTILLLQIFGCLQFLVMTNKGTMHSFLKGLDLGVETECAKSKHNICWNTLEIFSFPKCLYHDTFLPTIYDTFQLLYILASIWYVGLSNLSHCAGCTVVPVLQWGDSPSLPPRLPLLLWPIIVPHRATSPQSFTEHQSKNSVFLTQKLHVGYVTTSKSRSVSPVVSKLLPPPRRLTTFGPWITFQSTFWPFSELSVAPHGCWHFFELQFCSPSLTGHLIPYSRGLETNASYFLLFRLVIWQWYTFYYKSHSKKEW